MIEGSKIEWTNLTEPSPTLQSVTASSRRPAASMIRASYTTAVSTMMLVIGRSAWASSISRQAQPARAEIFLHQINVTSVGAIEGEQRIRQTLQIQSRWQADRSFQKTSVNSPAVLVARGRSVAIGGEARQTLIFDQALRSSKGRTAA